MQYKASLRDENWSSLVCMWCLLPDGRPKIPFWQPKLLNLLARRPSELEEIKKKIRNIYSILEKGI